MKNIWICFLFLIFSLIACDEPPVVFMGPQPNRANAQEMISMMYHGVFLCDSDSAVVHVGNRIIYKEKPFAFSMTPEELEESDDIDLIGDQIVVEGWPEPLPVKVTDSLIYSQIVLRDTLFHMGPNQVLKNYKGHMILNKKIEINKWEVFILSLDDELNIRLSATFMPEDIEKLEKITPVNDISNEDRDQILLAPTYMEFEEILRQQLIFEECDVFTRVASVLQI